MLAGLAGIAGFTSTASVPPTTPQPPFANVVFLAGFEGADGSTSLGNSEGNLAGLAMTAQGNAQIDTAQFKFGSSSILLDGTGDYVSLADNANWSPSTNGFVAEAWIRFAAGANLSANHAILTHYNATGAQRSWMFTYFGSAGELRFMGTDSGTGGGSITTQVAFAWVPTTGVWYHVVAERSSSAAGTYRLYIDGVMVAKSTTGISGAYFNSTAGLVVGATASGGDPFNGWIDEARLTNGHAHYNSDAGFLVPSAAFPRS